MLEPGDEIFISDLRAVVEARHVASRRLIDIRFDREGDALAEQLYALGRPVQYRHLERALRLSEVQTPYAARPWAIEMPSTGRPLRWPLLHELERRGVVLGWLTEAAGLSATGDKQLDAALPLAERYDIPPATSEAIKRAKARGGRVIAAGTTVARALEASGGRAGFGIATNRIGSHSRLRVADALITGVHSPGESHWELLRAFAPRPELDRAHRIAAEEGLLAHEMGDLMLVL